MSESKMEKINFKYNLKQYWSILSNYKGMIALLIVVTLLTEASYLVDKFLFKEVVDRGTEYIAGNLSQPQFLTTIWIALAIFIALLVIRPVLKWVSLHFLFILSTNAIFDLKKRMFNHLVRLSHKFHTTHKTGSMISRLIRGGWAIDSLNDIVIFSFAPLVLQTVIVGAAMLAFDPASAVVVFGVIIVFITYSYILNKWQEKPNIKANDQEDFEKGLVSDVFTNIDSIKYFGKEDQIEKKYHQVNDKTRATFLYHWNHFRWLSAGQTLILLAGTLLIIYFPLQKLLAGTMSIGTLVFIYTAYGNIIGPLFSFDHGMRQYYKAMADFESLFYYYRIENEIKDKPNAGKLRITQGKIEFKNVHFRYKSKNVLKNFSLVINPNEKVAFVGASGAGKSTIVKLLYRLYDLDKGEILIDGKNIADVKQESLRGELSIVPQECVLFDDTLYNNVKFSNKSSQRSKVMQALKFAQLDKTVAGMPDKENTIVGERGVKLSGGEKQRVSIARALLANKKILVLDEATSALDSETEHEIQKDLARLMEGRTAIIIAHRLSTIMRADKIVVLDKGKIAQIGKHSELIKKDGIYKKLWNLQKGGYIK